MVTTDTNDNSQTTAIYLFVYFHTAYSHNAPVFASPLEDILQYLTLGGSEGSDLSFKKQTAVCGFV
jgi:hypothetical protein